MPLAHAWPRSPCAQGLNTHSIEPVQLQPFLLLQVGVHNKVSSLEVQKLIRLMNQLTILANHR